MRKSLMFVASILPLAACGGGADPKPAAAQESAPEPQIPTQDELDVQAAEEIDAQNADAEMEKLKKEIQEGG